MYQISEFLICLHVYSLGGISRKGTRARRNQKAKETGISFLDVLARFEYRLETRVGRSP